MKKILLGLTLVSFLFVGAMSVQAAASTSDNAIVLQQDKTKKDKKATKSKKSCCATSKTCATAKTCGDKKMDKKIEKKTDKKVEKK